ncbi:MAG: hypothetical protein ABI763_04085 [Bacteroidota bacterium]
METKPFSIPTLAVKAGFIICASFIAYFMVMKYCNLTQYAVLRFLNLFILTGGLLLTFRYYRRKTKILNIAYFDGLLLGVVTSLTTFLLFAVFIYNYFLYVDPLLLQELKGNTVMMGNSLTAFTASATILVEGICAGVILTFIIMQYFKSGFYRTLQEKMQNKMQGA